MDRPDFTDRHLAEIAELETHPTLTVLGQVGRVGDEIRKLLSASESHHTPEGKAAEFARLAEGLTCLEHVLRGRYRNLKAESRAARAETA